jgi:hypothetical protein
MSPLVQALAESSRHWIGDSPTGAMLSTMRAFLAGCAKDDSLLREAASSLSGLEPGSVAFVAVALGSAVERGASAESSGPAVVAQLQSWLPHLPSSAGEGADETPPTPDQAMLLARFQFVCQSAVTHLARLPELRAVMAEDQRLLERLDELRAHSPGAWWVHEALLKASGTLLLLHPPSATGLRLRYTNVSNCFHLFTLLQTAVGSRIPGGQDRAGPITQGDEAWWHYGSPRSPKPDLSASIRGEGLVRDIPRVDGEQVVLLWPLLRQGRTWDAGFLTPHLDAMPADAVVEGMLTPDESRAWLDKLGVTRQQQPWWRRWLQRRTQPG